jgi:hypothetical protein
MKRPLMNETALQLSPVLEWLNIEAADFYCITIRSTNIQLQGDFSSVITREIISKPHIQEANEDGYIQFLLVFVSGEEKSEINVTITLT